MDDQGYHLLMKSGRINTCLESNTFMNYRERASDELCEIKGKSEGKSSKIFLSLICLSSSSIISAFPFSFFLSFSSLQTVLAVVLPVVSLSS